MPPRLLILIYHRVHAQADPLRPNDVDAQEFERHMAVLARWYRPTGLAQGLRALAQGRLPRRSVAVTFDDGYADNLTVAEPIMARHGVPGTFFVASGYLDGGRMWNDTVIEAIGRAEGGQIDLSRFGHGVASLHSPADRLKCIRALIRDWKYRNEAERAQLVAALAEQVGGALPDDLMMTSGQVRQLRASGMEIGAHTQNHPILARLPPRRALEEILSGRERLVAIIGEPVRGFAYPNGRPDEDYCAEHVAMVAEAGFDYAVATQPGAATAASPMHELPRCAVWGRSRLRFGIRALAPFLQRSQAPRRALPANPVFGEP